MIEAAPNRNKDDSKHSSAHCLNATSSISGTDVNFSLSLPSACTGHDAERSEGDG
jgi:hypothetical protein